MRLKIPVRTVFKRLSHTYMIITLGYVIQWRISQLKLLMCSELIIEQAYAIGNECQN